MGRRLQRTAYLNSSIQAFMLVVPTIASVIAMVLHFETTTPPFRNNTSIPFLTRGLVPLWFVWENCFTILVV